MSSDRNSPPDPACGGPLDMHVGARIRQRREELGLDFAVTARSIGLSNRAFAELEGGQARATPAQLALLSVHFDVAVTWFFENIPEPVQSSKSSRSSAGTVDNIVPLSRSQERTSQNAVIDACGKQSDLS